ncbi:hypothetical protein E2C01_101383 [Portunus trituberculatus]|uniref:Uncharacterized protein n=1 Tax=Portunus trituberculatus TaxID=210409 RepID=A0A5B7K9G8_PORTR|nr:hypothetical protein [Portunus trituberculatus]
MRFFPSLSLSLPHTKFPSHPSPLLKNFFFSTQNPVFLSFPRAFRLPVSLSAQATVTSGCRTFHFLLLQYFPHHLAPPTPYTTNLHAETPYYTRRSCDRPAQEQDQGPSQTHITSRGRRVSESTWGGGSPRVQTLIEPLLITDNNHF